MRALPPVGPGVDRRFAVPAGVTDWTIAVGVAALLLGTGLSGPHPAGGRELPGCTRPAGRRRPRAAGHRSWSSAAHPAW
ncbi:hypothetical protein [Streptomyces poonensis]|uniref:Uncharacterized protein n=1 Tax=Streptomyces poonensis TaxID=68255 RepID=A0A918UQU8_9ACTN|nr:hypothetical protein [Streptomyces poonensis]GGZ28000.1 hypothetical protein GCM10010365_55420 [Streptomyces poonensis]GLJ89772.1 hypothetical protein GCM10017589_23730 [Streptomyces poonensis]